MRTRAALADTAVVFVFVVLGREAHQESRFLSDVAKTAAPFLIALGGGWGVMRAWRRPEAPTVGLGLSAATVSGGMLLRRFVFREGTAFPFVIVAAVFVTTGLVGWRLAVRAAGRRRAATAA